MDLSTAKYIMDYIYFNRANETAFKYYKKVSFSTAKQWPQQTISRRILNI